MDLADIYTPRLALPLLAPSQARKHATVNDALSALDQLSQIAVTALDATDPPPEPAEGEALGIDPSGGSGAWEGRGGDIAVWQNGAWRFHSPNPGWVVWDAGASRLHVHDGSAWVPVGGEAAARAPLWGVNADADAANRLSVVSPGTLLTHEGDSHRLTINRATPADTASVVFQTGFDGTAEFGLAGSDAFELKVKSADGTWRTAIGVDPETAEVTLPESRAARSLPASLFADNGLFHADGDMQPASPSAFAMPAWMRLTNGAQIALEDSFATGGSANGPEATALAQSIFAPAALAGLRGFHTARLTAGPDTQFGTVFADGVRRYINAYRLRSAVLPAMTYSVYVKAFGSGLGLNGDAYSRYRVDGAEAGSAVVVLDDGNWHHIRLLVDRPPNEHPGRDLAALSFYLEPGSAVLIAFPAALPGLHEVPPDIGPIASLSRMDG